MYRAYLSQKPFSNEKIWTKHNGSTAEEVRKKIMADYEYAYSWNKIFIDRCDDDKNDR